MSKRSPEKHQQCLMLLLALFLAPLSACISSEHPKKIASPTSYNSQGRGLAATAMHSIDEENETSLMKELFDPSAPAQQNINPNTTMPMVPHTVKEMKDASGME